MWPFKSKSQKREIGANRVSFHDGVAEIDVRGQTCPGYLLAINKAVDKLEKGTEAKLLITYPPCGDDIKAWCKERNIEFIDLAQQANVWIARVRK